MSESRTVVWGLRVGGIALLVAVWALAVRGGGISPLVLPAPERVVETFIGLLGSADFYRAALFTLGEILAAFVIAAVAGIGIGAICARTPLTAKVTEPMFVWGYLAPSVLFFPLFILWLGPGPVTTIAFGTIMALFPIVYSTIRALTNIDTGLVRMARAYGASGRQIDRLVKFPAAIPMIAVGLRIGAASALITVVLGEMLASTFGLAHDLTRAQQMYNAPLTYALIIAVVALAAVVQVIIHYVLRPRWSSQS